MFIFSEYEYEKLDVCILDKTKSVLLLPILDQKSHLMYIYYKCS